MLEIATKTLDEMAQGGIYDQLGGAFHRYSVDERWVVPHFEKMLYDNSGLLENYAQGYLASRGEALYKEIAEGIVSYTTDWGSDQAQGGFYASQDADINLEDDGNYFTWTRKEAEAALGQEEAQVIIPYYDIYETGEMREDPDRNVLFVAKSVEEIAASTGFEVEKAKTLLASGQDAMRVARLKRQAPFVDPTLYTNWNGMMIRAYLKAYRVFGWVHTKDFALKTVQRFLDQAYSADEGMAHSVNEGSVRGIFDDQAHFALALVSAYEVTGNTEYLATAENLMKISFERYWDQDKGGFFDRDQRLASEGGMLDAPQKIITDASSPSGNGIAVQVLMKLFHITGKDEYESHAKKTLETFSNEAASSGIFTSAYAVGLHSYLNPPLHAVILGKPSDPKAQALAEAVFTTYRPGKVISWVDPDNVNDPTVPELARAQVKAVTSSEATAFVCSATACAEPTQDPSTVAGLVKHFR